jgi:hypothetical protein
MLFVILSAVGISLLTVLLLSAMIINYNDHKLLLKETNERLIEERKNGN